MELYTDIKNEDLSHFNVLFGGRGIGKTFSVLRHKVEWSIETGRKFIWLRDTETIVKKLFANHSLTKAQEIAIANFPHTELRKIDDSINICTVDNDGNIIQILGYLMALSTFHNARGLNYEDVDCIIWDEFMPEDGVVKTKALGTLFDNMYETVNRNREFSGADPVQIILLSNTNDIYSEVLENWGIAGIIENMQQNDKRSYKDEDIWIEFFSNKSFYEKKKNTFQYRLSHNEKFKNMALDNNFNNSFALIKKSINYKGSKALMNLDNKYVLIQLADGSLYWKLGNYKNLINYDMNNDQEAILFRMLFTDKLRKHYIIGQMFFDSIYTQRTVLEYAKF